MNGNGQGPLRQVLEQAAAESGCSLHALTVLSSQRDPYRLDTPAGHRDGKWFAQQVDRFLGGTATIHLRGLHYRISASADVRKPNGLPYTNTDPDWEWLQESAAKAARWLGYVPFERIGPSVPAPAPKPLESPVVTPSEVNQEASSPAPPEHPVAPYDVSVTMRLVAELPNNEPIRVRSVLGSGSERVIQLSLNAGNLIVSRSLKRADTLIIKFLLAMALSEYLQFWVRRADGRALRTAITKAAAIESEQFWGITLASKLTASELLRSLDATPIFGPAPSQDAHTLFTLSAVRLREISDLPNWRPRTSEKKEEASHA